MPLICRLRLVHILSTPADTAICHCIMHRSSHCRIPVLTLSFQRKKFVLSCIPHSTLMSLSCADLQPLPYSFDCIISSSVTSICHRIMHTTSHSHRHVLTLPFQKRVDSFMYPTQYTLMPFLFCVDLQPPQHSFDCNLSSRVTTICHRIMLISSHSHRHVLTLLRLLCQFCFLFHHVSNTVP